MHLNRRSILGAVLVLLCFCANIDASGAGLTPLPGSPLRKVVLHALRQEVARIHGLDVVFVVRHLRIKNGWAWVHTRPQSPDGLNRYEDVSALLQLQNDAWEVVEIACGEAGNLDCLDGPDYFVGLQERFPQVAPEIFPDRTPGQNN
jgi:hypothetical protein